jgi:hypothetical protein
MIDSTVASNGNFTFYVSSASDPLYPTQYSPTTTTTRNEDNVTVITSNISSRPHNPNVLTHALAMASVTLKTKDVISDSGATQIFVMENTPIINKCIMDSPLKVALADGRKVFSTHECDIHIVGLPTVLTGNITPDLSFALLFGIRVLIEAGCKVSFNKHKCTVWYDNKIILEGGKDSTTDVWTLLIGLPRPASSIKPPPAYLSNISHAHCATTQIAFFTHTVRNKANSIGFAHQALCSPCISILLKAIHHGFLKGCPNLSAKGLLNI